MRGALYTSMLTWNGDKIMAATHRVLGNRLDECARALVYGIRREAPVDTGFMRDRTTIDSIDRTRLHAVVESHARYSGFVHEGFSPKGPRVANKYFERGVEKTIPHMKSILERPL